MKYKRMARKRIRGLRRHSRNHRRWAAIPQELDLKILENCHSNYEQLGVGPWTVHGKPTLALRKLWATRLLLDLQQWQMQLAQHYAPAEFYLAVWLYEPRFGKSQLVAMIDEQKARYEYQFGEDAGVPLPLEYQTLLGVDKLCWTAHPEVDVFDFEEFAELGAWASRKPHWEAESKYGPCMVVQTGWRWVGRTAG